MHIGTAKKGSPTVTERTDGKLSPRNKFKFLFPFCHQWGFYGPDSKLKALKFLTAPLFELQVVMKIAGGKKKKVRINFLNAAWPVQKGKLNYRVCECVCLRYFKIAPFNSNAALICLKTT